MKVFEDGKNGAGRNLLVVVGVSVRSKAGGTAVDVAGFEREDISGRIREDDEGTKAEADGKNSFQNEDPLPTAKASQTIHLLYCCRK